MSVSCHGDGGVCLWGGNGSFNVGFSFVLKFILYLHIIMTKLVELDRIPVVWSASGMVLYYKLCSTQAWSTPPSDVTSPSSRLMCYVTIVIYRVLRLRRCNKGYCDMRKCQTNHILTGCGCETIFCRSLICQFTASGHQRCGGVERSDLWELWATIKRNTNRLEGVKSWDTTFGIYTEVLHIVRFTVFSLGL